MMKFKNIILFIVFCLFVIQPTKVESSDIVSDILGTALEKSKQYKLELEKWGLKKKDLKALKSKEIKSLLNGNIIFGEWNDDYLKGKTESTYYDDGSYEAVVSGKWTDGGKKATLKEKGTWSAKQGKVCFKGVQFNENEEREYDGCVKVLKSKTNPNDYYLRHQGVIYLKFVKIISIKDKIEEERVAKKKKEEEKRLAKLKAEEEKKQQEEEEKRIAEEEKRIAEEEKRIAEEEKRIAEEEKKIAEEEKKITEEIEKPKKEKLAELESYITSNRQLLEKADQINSLLLELKNDTERKEGEKLIAEYNSKFLHTLTTIGNIPALDTKQIEAFKIDTKMHLALEEYVKKHEGNISSYQAQIQVALKAEQEKQEALEAQKKAEQEKKEKEFLESYAGKIDGYQDVKFGMDIDQVKDALGGKCSLYYNADKFRYLASGYSAGTTTVHHDAIRSLMNFYSILYGEKCYQVLSGYPDLSFGFDEDYRLISVLTSNLMNTELINSIQMDQLKEVVKKIKNKYQMWFPPGTTAEDWNSWVNEFNARNTEYILYAFEEGQVMLSIGLGGYKNWQNLYPTTLVMQMLYFSKKNQGAKDFYIGQLDKYAGTSSGKGL